MSMTDKERKTLVKRLREIENEKKGILKRLDVAIKGKREEGIDYSRLSEAETLMMKAGVTIEINTFQSSPYSLQGKVVNNTIDLIKKDRKSVV